MMRLARFAAVLGVGLDSHSLGVLAVEKGKGKKASGGFFGSLMKPLVMGSSLVSPFALADQAVAKPTHNPVAGMDTAAQFDYHQSELTALMRDEKKMRDRFDQFVVDFPRDYVNVAHHQSMITRSFDIAGDGKPPESKTMSSKKTTVTCVAGKDDECVDRYETFKQNVEIAHGRNVEGNGEVVHGITKFMDYSPAEFHRFFLGPEQSDESVQAQKEALKKYLKPYSSSSSGSTNKFMMQSASSKSNGDSKDWRDDGIITPIKDQGHCGSCWAHSVVEQTESMAIKAGQVPKTWAGSPQELVSCDKGSVDNGCHGGSTLFGFDYLLTHGLESEQDYPYTSGTTEKDGKCKIKKSKERISSAGDGSLFDSEDEMTQYILDADKGGPISIAVDASKWSTYVSGIFPPEQCMGQIDHAVQAVALNQAGDKPYWVVRNSWNTNWGEDGFIRLKAGVDACKISSMPATWDTKKVHHDDATASLPMLLDELKEVAPPAIMNAIQNGEKQMIQIV